MAQTITIEGSIAVKTATGGTDTPAFDSLLADLANTISGASNVLRRRIVLGIVTDQELLLADTISQAALAFLKADKKMMVKLNEAAQGALTTWTLLTAPSTDLLTSLKITTTEATTVDCLLIG